MRAAWIAEQGQWFALSARCEGRDVRVSGYRAWPRGGILDRKRLTASPRLALIRALHAELKKAYGSPRMVREGRMCGFSARKAGVERLMRENGISALTSGATR